MSRIRTQEDFIKKANEVHDNKYDYSLVEYVKTSVKVKIICPIHGVFEQAPNKHLAGQGCKQCGRERTRMGVDEFIKRAKEVHGDKYDYSKIHEYKSINDKVEIVCPVHGSFWQTPHCHVVLKQNCPKCSNESGGKKRCGDKNVAHRDDVKQKKAETCMQRFGAKTWAESDEGRKKLREIVTSEEVSQKMQDTCMKRYGAEMWSKSDEGREKLHELMSSEEMRKKVADGYQQKYGSHYMQTDEGREKARQSTKYRIAGMIKRYGVAYAMQNPESKAKSWRTKIKRHTFSTSKSEQVLYTMLCDIFGKNDVVMQYIDEDRYPFYCDFYIRSKDLFIELNAHWSHGGHWFDENNESDIEQLTKWREKSRKKGSRYYYRAIEVWTHRDLLKRDTAIKNNLNYAAFWKSDLSDAQEYLMKVVYNEIAK